MSDRYQTKESVNFNNRRNKNAIYIKGSEKKVNLVENEFVINNEFLDSKIREIFLDDVRIFSIDHNVKKKLVFYPEKKYPPIQMHFLLNGSHSMKSRRTGEICSFTSNQHNVIYRPHDEMDITMNTSSLAFLGIQFSEKFFYRFIDENSEPLSTFWENIENKKEARLVNNKNLFLTPKIKSIVYEIINSKSKGSFQKIFLEAKIIELLVSQLELINQNDGYSKLKNTDKEKLYEVKNILEQNVFSEFSLMGLARKVGINDFKLKKGFKELFGTTVFGYLNDLRMDQAKYLILDEKKNIFEVADILGYSESHHFSAAFKRRFGYLPSKLRS